MKIRKIALFFLILSHFHVLAQTPQVKERPLRAHLAFLADDLLEGRGTGQRGGDLAVHYLETQASLIGLQALPLLKDETKPFRQTVHLIGTQTHHSTTVNFQAHGKSFSPQLGGDILVASSNGRADALVNVPLVFVGYGVRAPEEQWDDYKGVDVKGKLLIMMANDPQPTTDEPHRFGGKAMTYYGRWMYKFEEAARQGAAGVLLIHTLASATYGWNVPHAGFMHERFSLAGGGNALEGWWKEESAKAFFQMAGLDLDSLRAKAEQRDFKPVAMSASANISLKNTVRALTQFNVMGMVPGTDARLQSEAIIYSAHWDHLGIVEESGKPPQIWNGAVDNATGAAALLAMAQEAVKHPAKRTQIFLWPSAEEQGLIGSLFYVQHPVWPMVKTLADLNLDSMNFVGKTEDIGIAGSERSSLQATATQVAKKMHMKIATDVPDLGGAYYRADHFNFARFGVPAFNVGSAVFSGDGQFEFVEESVHSMRKMKGFKNDYHTDRDRYDPSWNLSGMLQQAQFTLNLGYAIANSKNRPTWKKGDPYGLIKPRNGS